MSGLGGHLPGFGPGYAGQVSQADIDQYVVYDVLYPSVTATWIGTTAVGTSTQAKALVLINQNTDYPRNLCYYAAGSNDIGGTWTIKGKDQFGSVVTESVGFGTIASPGGSAYGTQIFSQVTSGTFQFAVGSAGSGTPKLGFGSVGTSTYFGLPSKIAGTLDVKTLTYINNGAVTTFNGGTIGAYVNTTTHSFQPVTDLAITAIYRAVFKPTFDNTTKGTMSGL